MKYSRIAEERKKLGLSQAELANKLNISQKSISKYECGTRRPSYEILVDMSSIFGVSVDYLLGVETSNSSTTHYEENKKEYSLFFDDLLRNTFTSRLKKTINKKNFTEDMLTKLLSMDMNKIQSYINGDCKPSLENLISISQVLEVSIDYLLGKINIQEDKLLHNFQCLNEDNQDIIIGEVKKFLKEQKYEEIVATDELKEAK